MITSLKALPAFCFSIKCSAGLVLLSTRFVQSRMKGIKLLENDYLGGSGSRGYGQIKFGEFVKTELSDANNWNA